MGLSEEQLAGLATEALTDPPFSSVQQVVIRYARQLTRMDSIDDDLYTELQRAFTLQEIMELCFTVGISNIVNRFHATFHTPLDDRTRDTLGSASPLDLPDEPKPSV